MAEEEQKGHHLAILGIVAVLAVVGLVLLFKSGAGGSTGAVVSPDTQQPCSDVGTPSYCSGTILAHPITPAAADSLPPGWYTSGSLTSPTGYCAVTCTSVGGGLDCSDDLDQACPDGTSRCTKCKIGVDVGCNDGDMIVC